MCVCPPPQQLSSSALFCFRMGRGSVCPFQPQCLVVVTCLPNSQGCVASCVPSACNSNSSMSGCPPAACADSPQPSTWDPILEPHLRGLRPVMCLWGCGLLFLPQRACGPRAVLIRLHLAPSVEARDWETRRIPACPLAHQTQACVAGGGDGAVCASEAGAWKLPCTSQQRPCQLGAIPALGALSPWSPPGVSTVGLRGL